MRGLKQALNTDSAVGFEPKADVSKQLKQNLVSTSPTNTRSETSSVFGKQQTRAKSEASGPMAVKLKTGVFVPKKQVPAFECHFLDTEKIYTVVKPGKKKRW